MADANKHLLIESTNSKDAIPRVKLVQRFETGLTVKQIVFLESALSFLLITEKGEIYVFENGQEVPRKLEGQCSAHQIHALYASSRHSLILQAGDKLLIRRDQNGVFLLQKAFVDSVIEGGNAAIEVPVQEVIEWQKFFATEFGRNATNECPELQKLEIAMNDAMQVHQGAESQALSLVINICKVHEFVTNLDAAVTKLLKMKYFVYPVFPLVFWLIERIRWVLDRERPYHLLQNKIQKGRNVDTSVMNSEAARVLSFYKWPHMDYQFALPYRMAETGFFFQPSNNDRVVCFSCRLSLVMWEPNDEPLQEHERHHTTACQFMEDAANENTPLDVTTACQPSASLPFDDASVVIASTMNASAEFFALMDATNPGVIRMFHLDSAPLQPFIVQLNFVMDLKRFYPEISEETQTSTITALSVAGCERFIKASDESDADCLLYTSVSIASTSKSFPCVFIYKISRQLKEKIDKSLLMQPPPKLMPIPPPPMSIADVTMLSEADPSSSSTDDVIDVDFWTPEQMMDDNFDPVEFKNKSNKKSRARHDELNPCTEIEYAPYKLKAQHIGLIELQFEGEGDWIIDNIVASDIDNGIVSISAFNETQHKSATAHFARRSDLHRFASGVPFVKIHYFDFEIQKLVILPVDHFASFRASNFEHPEPFGPTIVVQNVIMLTKSKKVLLLDTVSGTTVEIDSNVKDFIMDDKQNLVLVSENGEMKTMHVAASLTGMQSERIDEAALTMIASLQYSRTASMIEDIKKMFSTHPNCDRIVQLLQNLPINQKLISPILECVHALIKSHPVKSNLNSRIVTKRTAIAALEAYLQHSLGFQITSPPHWTEVVRSVYQKSAPIGDSGTSGNSPSRVKESPPKDDYPRPTRAWKFSSEKENPRPGYVFKMAIIPGMPLSHINFKFHFISNSNGCPDASFTIFRAKEFGSLCETSSMGETTNLIPYCEDPSLLEAECEKMLGPMKLENCVDSESTFATIQISSAVILESLASANLKDDWFTKPVILYLLIEVSKRPSLAQQIISRTQLVAQAARTRSRSDKAKISRSTTGGMKKKFHPRKAFIAKNTKSSALKGASTASGSRLAIIKRKDASSSRRQCESPVPNPNEVKDGIMYIEEFSITLFRCEKHSKGHEQLQRLILQRDKELHIKLFDIALRQNVADLGFDSLDAIRSAQLRALDLLIWTTQSWRLSSKYFAEIAEFMGALNQNYAQLFTFGFATASSQVAQKWCIFIGQILRILVNQDGDECQAAFTQLINHMKTSISNDLGKIEKAGALHWFLATVFATVYESTFLLVDGDHIAAANELAEKSVVVLRELGDTFQNKWSASLHQTLSTKYSLSGLVFDLHMFDFPHQLLGYRTPNETATVESEMPRGSAFFKSNTNPMINAMTGYIPPMGFPPSASMYLGPNGPMLKPPTREASASSRSLPSDGDSLVSGKFFPYSEHETLSLMELLNMNVGSSDDCTWKKSWAPSIMSERDWFDLEDKQPDRSRTQIDVTSKYTWNRFPVGPELLPSLAENEPLSFECIGPGDYIQVYNCDTQEFSSVNSSGTKLIIPLTKAAEVHRILASIHDGEFMGTANYQLSNEIFSVFKPPADLVLSVERVTPNSRRQIVLDFGPTLLKSFIIPPSEYLQAIYVDGWWSSEESDMVRIAQSTNIKSKALIVSNMQPGILIQKLRISFVMKGPSTKARIPLGRYFGSKWLTKADLVSAFIPYDISTGDPVSVHDSCIDANLARPLTRMLQYFGEELRCRYNIVAAELKKSIEEGYSSLQIHEAYTQCYNLRLQYCISYNVMKKMQSEISPVSEMETHSNMGDKTWPQLELDHLKTLSSYMLNFCNELTNVLDLRDSSREISTQTLGQTNGVQENEDTASANQIIHIQPTQILTLENAIDFFDFYCTNNVPSLKALGCAHLFKNGCFTTFWGDFFPEILRKYFSGTENSPKRNETFIVLSILCAHSVKHSHLQQTVMEKLFKFIITVSKELAAIEPDDYSTCSNSPLLSWTLQLLSTSFDVVSCNKRKTDRWAFLAGLFGQSSAYVPSMTQASESTHPRTLPILNSSEQLCSRDKIFTRWKEIFNYDDFLTELEKPQFIARRLDILADRLSYLHALIREEFDGTPAILPPKRGSFSLPLSSTTANEATQKSATPPLVDAAATRLLIVPLHNLQSRVRVRQYSARLKISETLCLSVVQHLLDLLLHKKSKQLFPYTSQLLAVKVISKICLHGSTASISLTSALGERLYDLVFQLLNASKVADWMRYAVLMLLVDLTDAEIRTLGRNLSNRQMRAVLEDIEDIGIEAKRHKPDIEIEMSEENSINNEFSDHAMEDLTIPEADPMPEVIIGDEGSQTAVSAGVNDSPWAFVPPSVDFVSFANFDKLAPEQADEYIIRAAVATLIGMKDSNPTFLVPTPNKDISEETRFAILIQWFYRLTRYFYDRGEPITHIFRYFDEALIGEEEHWSKCNTRECYVTTFHLAIFENTRLGTFDETEKLDKSVCAGAFIAFCNAYMTDERKAAALKAREKPDNIPRDALELRFYQSSIEAKYHVRLCGMRHLCREMQIPDVELQKAINGHMMRIRFKLPELTSMALDANGEKMVSADPESIRTFDSLVVSTIRNHLDLRAMLKKDKSTLEKVLNVYSKMIFISVTWPDLEDFTKFSKPHPLSEQTLVEMTASGETPPDLSSIGQSNSEPIQPLDTAELKCALENLTTEVQVSGRVRHFNQAVHLQFAADLTVAGDNVLVQPNSTCINLLADMQFGSQPVIEALYREQMRGIIARNSLYNFVPHCASVKKSAEEGKELTPGAGHSVRSIVSVIDKYLSSLDSQANVETLLNVLTLYLEFTGYVHCITSASSSTKTFSLEKGIFEPPPLSVEALTRLIKYITVTPVANEHLWQNILTTITRNIRKDPQNLIISAIPNGVDLQKFLSKFFNDSLHVYGIGTGFGPTALEHMGMFLSRLLASDGGNGKILEQYVDCLNTLFVNPGPNTLGALPIETLSAIVDIVGQGMNALSKNNTCDVQKISLLLYRVVTMMRRAFPRFNGILKTSNFPGKAPTASNTQLSQANICFSSISPPSTAASTSPRTENPDIIKLPSLSFTITKSASSETAGRRLKNAHKMWQASSGVSDPFEYETFESGFDSMRAYTSEQVYEKPSMDRTESLFVLLIKFVDSCAFLGPVWLVVVQRFPETITTIINLLSECESATNVTEVQTEFWNPLTLADHLLYLLLAISNAVGQDGENPLRFMTTALQGIFTERNDQNGVTKISDPLMFTLVKINQHLKRRELFVQMNGHQRIAEQLRKCLLLVNDRWPGSTSMFSLGQQLTNVANEVIGIVPQTFDIQNLPSKTVNGIRVYNFSPASRINGHSVNTSSLANILMDPIPHRRSRHSAYAYTFPQGELWTSVTISLPCQIMLSEIQIRCHQYSMNTPSAVQVEFSADVLPARHWALFGGNIVTAGLLSTVIDTSHHRIPTGAIRLHLRRPNGFSGTINLSQILLYGTVSSPTMRAEAAQEKALVNWLLLYDKFQCVQPSLWKYASTLPQKLMQLFIRMNSDHRMYPLLRQVISNVDLRARSNEATIIELILKHVFSGGRLSDGGVTPVVSAEMLYSFCTESGNITVQRAAVRQQQLLVGIEYLLSLIDDRAIFDDTTFSIILWAAACIIWNNVGNGNLRYQTLASCLEVGNRIQPSLWKLATSTSNNHKLLKPSAAWLLCSLFRADSNLARQTTEELRNKTNFTKDELRALAQIYQSESAAIELINSGLLTKFIDESIKISKQLVNSSTVVNANSLKQLIDYIEFVAALSVIGPICVFLQQPVGQELFKSLLPALVYCGSVKTAKETLSSFANLDSATVLLCQRCIAYSNSHRKLIANILTELLSDEKSQFCGRLDGTLLQLILRLVLEDEVVSLRVKGIQGPNFCNDAFSSRILHPVFGCTSTDRIFQVSIFTPLRDIIPLRQSEATKPKTNYPCTYDELGTFESMMSHKKKSDPETNEPSELVDGVVCDELGQKSLVARIFCEQISSTRSIALKLSLKDIFWHTCVRENENFEFDSNGKISRSSTPEPKTFGFLTVLAEVRVGSRTDGTFDEDFKPEIPASDLTMLQHFAMVGGFSQLSHHFPMADHYSAVLETYEDLCKKQRQAATKLSSGPTAENAIAPKPPKPSINQVAFATHQLQQHVQNMLGQYVPSSSSSPLQAMIAGTPVSLSVLEPSAIVSYQNGNGDPNTLAAIMNNFPGTSSSAGMNDSNFQSFGNSLNFVVNSSNGNYPYILGGMPASQMMAVAPSSFAKTAATSALNARQNGDLESNVSAYTIFALSMFLKLDYYAITLVTCDRNQAKRVLRSAMGLTNDEKEMVYIMASFRPIMPRGSSNASPIIVMPKRDPTCGTSPFSSVLFNQITKETKKREAETQTIYPFYVLEKVWTLSGPNLCGKEISSNIRFMADAHGVLDVILLCISRFSNTPPRWQVAYPPSSDAQAIDQIFQITDQIETIRDAILSAQATAAAAKPSGNYSSLTSIMQQQQQSMLLDTPGPQSGGGQDFWAKGTGFGTGTTQAQWNLHEHVRRRKLSEEAITCMINTISGYLMPFNEHANFTNILADIGLNIAQITYTQADKFHKDPLKVDEQIEFTFSIISKIYNSCFMSLIQAYLTNDSVFDISKHVSVYEACIWFIITVASLKPVEASDEEIRLLSEPPKVKDILAAMLMEEYRGSMITAQMRKMYDMIKVYLSTIDKERQSLGKPPPLATEGEDEKGEDSHEEENLEALANLLEKALIILTDRLYPFFAIESQAMEVDKEITNIESMTLEDIYMQQLKKFQYESIPFMKEDSKAMEIPHHYSTQFLSSTATGNPKRMRRLAQEAITLSVSLPLTSSSSVFLRACEERLDVFKVLITGPADTPYANGCFEFDAYFPPDYPNVPVQISLQTTGGNSVRFNPNLYNDGKVCLSILNTWHGRPEERWNAETSSFLQVIVSIQSLILVNEPYFNEPGYERSRNTPAGQQASRDYDSNIRNQTVRWGMLEQLRHPPRGFEDVISRHFWIKRDEICEQITDWINEMQKFVNSSPEQNTRSIKSSLLGLTRSFEQLKDEFKKMTAPAGLESIESRHFSVKTEDDDVAMGDQVAPASTSPTDEKSEKIETD